MFQTSSGNCCDQTKITLPAGKPVKMKQKGSKNEAKMKQKGSKKEAKKEAKRKQKHIHMEIYDPGLRVAGSPPYMVWYRHHWGEVETCKPWARRRRSRRRGAEDSEAASTLVFASAFCCFVLERVPRGVKKGWIDFLATGICF